MCARLVTRVSVTIPKPKNNLIKIFLLEIDFPFIFNCVTIQVDSKVVLEC